MPNQLDDDAFCERVWALPFQRRVSILILSLIGFHRETVSTIQAFAKMSVKMSRLSSAQDRVVTAELLRCAADEIEKGAFVIAD